MNRQESVESRSYTFPEDPNARYVVDILRDTDAENPRAEHDHLGILAIPRSNRYISGDDNAPDSVEDINQALRMDAYAALPVYAYIHSGITISTGQFSCPWDSGQVGYIYATRADVRRAFKVSDGKRLPARKKVRKILQAEIDELDAYLTGDVFGYVVTRMEENDENDEDEDDVTNGEAVDSCWGFYGDIKYVMEEGRANAEHHAKHNI